MRRGPAGPASAAATGTVSRRQTRVAASRLAEGGEFVRCKPARRYQVTVWQGRDRLRAKLETVRQQAPNGAVCGQRSDGTLACWGANDEGQSSPPVS